MKNPAIINNYQLLKETGLLDYIETLRLGNRGLEDLLTEASEIFRKESVEELVTFVIACFSDKFIPSNLVFILNQGIMVNRIKTVAYKNLKKIDSEFEIKTLEPYENFFRKYTGTTSFLIFESEFRDSELAAPFVEFNPEIIVPVNGFSGLYGIILFGPKVLGQEYSTQEISYINQLIKFTSIGIQNNIHYEHSVREPKTGLYNHNFFVRRVDEEIARAKRTKKSFSVIILDIDKFKHFNDTYGHLAGDEIILNLADMLKQTVREEDILSRFGGEEFMALLPDAGREAAWIAAERIRKAVEEMTTPYEKQALKITISLGIATFDEEHDDTVNIFREADKALYLSKEGGRNKASFTEAHDF